MVAIDVLVIARPQQDLGDQRARLAWWRKRLRGARAEAITALTFVPAAMIGTGCTALAGPVTPAATAVVRGLEILRWP